MDRRSWPWKKKSSDKYTPEKAVSPLDSADASLAEESQNQNATETYRKPSYVQISVESYTHMSGLEDQVIAYEEQVKVYKDKVKSLDEQIEELNEKLSDANSEMTNKEELVEQHAKVAEEAVSGWEKAESEAASLKTHLEAVTLAKLTVEDRAAQLDGALKECMRQIRDLKEEHEQKVQDVILTKNKQYEKMKLEFEAKIAAYDQELGRSQAENDALSRSLQDRSNMLIKISEERSQAEAEIELLKNNIESCEREINSLKYELHIVSKELEIRNEEKNMSAKSADVANKQHMESVKKIAKLEAECQRLRSLVRKKLPGPAALAQMKLEVEYMGQGYGESRFRKSPAKPSSHAQSHFTEYSVDGSQKFQKENEFLTERLFVMEEETKMLKEALARRTSELQASRSTCVKTANKLQSLEVQLHGLGRLDGSAKRSSIRSASVTSMSEDGNDDITSAAESCGSSALFSEMSHMKDKQKDKPMRTDSTNCLELMDDFLEMEKLLNHPEVDSVSKEENSIAGDSGSLVMKIQSRISKVFESVSNDAEIELVLEKLKHIVQEAYDTIQPHSVTCVFEEKRSSGDSDSLIAVKREISLLENGVQETDQQKVLNKEMVSAITEIHSFILSLVEAASVAFHGASDEEDGLNNKVEHFSASINKVVRNETSLADFVLNLSQVAEKVSDLSFKFVGFKNTESEPYTPDCIDKVALPENKESQGERFSNGCSHISDSSSNPEDPSEANFLPSSDAVSRKCLVESIEQLKVEKDNLVQQLTRSMEDLETTKSQLAENEQILVEVKSQLASSQKTNCLAETQLKCMAESYKSLEKRAEELETELSRLQTRVEYLESELQSEKASHQNDLIRCKDLEEQLLRSTDCSVCASMAADLENKNKQEKELASAAEKLAECQETIFQLGKQLKAMRPHDKEVVEEESAISGVSSRDSHQAEADTASSTNSHKMGAESPLYFYNNPPSPSNTDVHGFPILPLSSKHIVSMSGSSSASSTLAPEKHSRAFSRFFSSSKSSRRH
ncbi:hypothetical protein V2J09_017155 [Rumex salicifolius]